ncbi:MAG: threonine ammonia-lyase [Pelosinus sp.]|nr:threonine ammonia-lyase [Pelosinus sp.]
MHTEIPLLDIQTALKAARGVVKNTPLEFSATFSEMADCEVYLKLENLQKTGSFKIRGAYNKINSLTTEERAHGVIAASAGNHAQGVAYAARMAGVKATIVMPEVAPLAKIMATRGYGADVVLNGMVYDDAFQKATELQKENGQVFVHAFNDAKVIAGQGTIGLEIIEALSDVSAIIVPVGGGGLLAGVLSAVKSSAPHIKVYGVQAKGAAAMALSKQTHELKTTKDAITMADGIAVKAPGDLTFPIIDKFADDIVTVDDEDIAKTILMLLERAKLMVEGAGAISLAALLNKKIQVKGKVAAVLSGGNIDMNFISRIIERGLVQAGRRIRISTLIQDRPGILQRLLNSIAQCGGNVINVYHDRVERDVPIGQAVVEVSLETRDARHSGELVEKLKHEGYALELSE